MVKNISCYCLQVLMRYLLNVWTAYVRCDLSHHHRGNDINSFVVYRLPDLYQVQQKPSPSQVQVH